jgi:hypothetical protein
MSVCQRIKRQTPHARCVLHELSICNLEGCSSWAMPYMAQTKKLPKSAAPMALNGLKLARTRSLDHLPPAGGSRAVGLTSKLRCNQRSVAAWNIQRSWRLLLEFHPEARPKPVTLRSMDWFEGKSVLKKNQARNLVSLPHQCDCSFLQTNLRLQVSPPKLMKNRWMAWQVHIQWIFLQSPLKSFEPKKNAVLGQWQWKISCRWWFEWENQWKSSININVK